MLGEWQAMLDFSSNNNSTFDYYGDVLVFKSFEPDDGIWYYDGCRPDDSLVGDCSNNALGFHPASGFYNAAIDLQVIVVTDSPDTFLLYLVEVGTNAGQGEVTVYPRNGDPEDYDAYPMRMFRTASRSFVQDGEGPNKSRSTATSRSGLGDQLALAGATPQPKSNARSKYDRTALKPIIRALEQQLLSKRAPH
jgi:hypothetical protein